MNGREQNDDDKSNALPHGLAFYGSAFNDMEPRFLAGLRPFGDREDMLEEVRRWTSRRNGDFAGMGFVFRQKASLCRPSGTSR